MTTPSEPNYAPAVDRLRTAIEMEKTAKSLKDEALACVKAEIEQGLWKIKEGSKGTYQLPGMTLTRSTSSRDSVSTAAKERIEELKGDLKAEGLITKQETETWTSKLQ